MRIIAIPVLCTVSHTGMDILYWYMRFVCRVFVQLDACVSASARACASAHAYGCQSYVKLTGPVMAPVQTRRNKHKRGYSSAVATDARQVTQPVSLPSLHTLSSPPV